MLPPPMQGHQAANYASTSATAAAAACGPADSIPWSWPVEHQVLRHHHRAWLAGVDPRERALCQSLRLSDPATGAGSAADHGSDGGCEAPGAGALSYAIKLREGMR